jgi:hypothetical protein
MTSACSEDWGMTDISAAGPILIEDVIQKMQITTRNMMFRSQHQEKPGGDRRTNTRVRIEQVDSIAL